LGASVRGSVLFWSASETGPISVREKGDTPHPFSHFCTTLSTTHTNS